MTVSSNCAPEELLFSHGISSTAAAPTNSQATSPPTTILTENAVLDHFGVLGSTSYTSILSSLLKIDVPSAQDEGGCESYNAWQHVTGMSSGGTAPYRNVNLGAGATTLNGSSSTASSGGDDRCSSRESSYSSGAVLLNANGNAQQGHTMTTRRSTNTLHSPEQFPSLMAIANHHCRNGSAPRSTGSACNRTDLDDSLCGARQSSDELKAQLLSEVEQTIIDAEMEEIQLQTMHQVVGGGDDDNSSVMAGGALSITNIGTLTGHAMASATGNSAIEELHTRASNDTSTAELSALAEAIKYTMAQQQQHLRVPGSGTRRSSPMRSVSFDLVEEEFAQAVGGNNVGLLGGPMDNQTSMMVGYTDGMVKATDLSNNGWRDVRGVVGPAGVHHPVLPTQTTYENNFASAMALASSSAVPDRLPAMELVVLRQLHECLQLPQPPPPPPPPSPLEKREAFLRALLEQQQREPPNEEESSSIAECFFAECSDEELGGCVSKLLRNSSGTLILRRWLEIASPRQRQLILFALTQNIETCALSACGCRVLQKVIECGTPSEREFILRALLPILPRCVEDPNGNHVIQKVIEELPLDELMLDALRGKMVRISLHCYGCRVVQRLIERCSDMPANFPLLEEIIRHVPVLIVDQYGNYVIQHLLEYGSPIYRSRIASEIEKKFLVYSSQKFASHAVEKCFTCCDFADVQNLVMVAIDSNNNNSNGNNGICGGNAVFRDRGVDGVHNDNSGGGPSTSSMPVLLSMVRDRYANYVVQRMLSETAQKYPLLHQLLRSKLRENITILKKFTYGKHIVATWTKLDRQQQIGQSPSPQ